MVDYFLVSYIEYRGFRNGDMKDVTRVGEQIIDVTHFKKEDAHILTERNARELNHRGYTYLNDADKDGSFVMINDIDKITGVDKEDLPKVRYMYKKFQMEKYIKLI